MNRTHVRSVGFCECVCVNGEPERNLGKRNRTENDANNSNKWPHTTCARRERPFLRAQCKHVVGYAQQSKHTHIHTPPTDSYVLRVQMQKP